jgi:dihydroflavonol-4-reductase
MGSAPPLGKVLVTGASGFIGSAVARALVARGASVRLLMRPGSDRRNVAGLPAEEVVGDLADRASLERAVSGCDAVFHVAADYRLWVRDAAAMQQVNVDGTRWLMEAAMAAGVRRVVHTSSVATLGHRQDGRPADEHTPISLDDMVGPYKRSKFLGEREVRKLVERGLPAVIVNPSTPVGPHDIRPTPTGRLIVEAMAGRMPAYVDTGLNIVHVDDVAEGHLLALERGRIGERYILGGDDMSLAEILHALAAISGRSPPRVRLPRLALYPVAYASELLARLSGGEPFATVDGLKLARHHMYFSSRKAAEELGYSPRPAAEGLAAAAAWFRANGYLPG